MRWRSSARIIVEVNSVYQLKPRFQAALRPIAARLAHAGVSADAITTTAAAASIALGVSVAASQWRWLLLLYPVFLLVRMALNAIDGMVAREFSGPTPRGALLNELGDMASDAALYLPLALILPAQPWLVVAVVTVSLIGEAAGIAAQTIGATRRYDGPLGKSDRAVLFSLLAVLAALDVPAFGGWLPYVLGIALALAVWTVVNRVRTGLVEAAR